MSDDTRRALAASIAASAGGIPAAMWVESGGWIGYPLAVGGACLLTALALHVQRRDGSR